MKIGLFTEFSYPGKSEQQTYAEVLEQIALADALGYDFFSITESYGKDLFSCSPARRTRGAKFAFSPASSACPSTIRRCWRAKLPPRICLPMAGLWSASD